MNAISVPDLRVGEPTRCGTLAVFPLYPERTLFADGILDYLLSHEAQEAGTCVVRELSPDGKVGELLIENTDDRPVLFVEGEELVGARQNRVLRSSIIVGAGSQVVVSVFCTERGRWDRSLTGLRTGSHSPPSLRHLLKRSGAGSGFPRRRDDQVAVWRFIAAKHIATGTPSPKGNMSDAVTSHPEVVKELRRHLQYPEGACGIAAAVRGRTVGIDVFDKPLTLERLWDRLVILGLTLDAMDLRDADRHGDGNGEPVGLYMELMGNMRWHQESTVGLGEMYRATCDDGRMATALVMNGTPVHVSVSVPT